MIWAKRSLVTIGVVVCIGLAATLVRRSQRGRRGDDLRLRTIEAIRRNFLCRDFSFNLNVIRKYPDNQQYSQTFRIVGVVSEESDIFAETTSGDAADRQRYWLVVKGGEVVRATMRSANEQTQEFEQGNEGLNRFVLGDLTYREFHQIFALSAQDVDEIREEPGGYMVVSRRMTIPVNHSDPSITNRFVYHIDLKTYLPSTIEFFHEQLKIKEFHVEQAEAVGGRWTIRRGKLKDFRDASEALFESEGIRFDQNLEKKMLHSQDTSAK